MAKLRFATLCASTSIDYRDQSLSIFKVMDAIKVEGYPTAIPILEHISVWDREVDDEQIEVRILAYDPEGNQMLAPSVKTLQLQAQVHRYTLQLRGMIVTKGGDYSFITQIKGLSGRWRKVNETLLRVSQTES